MTTPKMTSTMHLSRDEWKTPGSPKNESSTSIDPLCQPKAGDARIRACILAFAEKAERGYVEVYAGDLEQNNAEQIELEGDDFAGQEAVSCAEIARVYQEVIDLRTAVAGFMYDDEKREPSKREP